MITEMLLALIFRFNKTILARYVLLSGPLNFGAFPVNRGRHSINRNKNRGQTMVYSALEQKEPETFCFPTIGF